jgi:hypothetical protein
MKYVSLVSVIALSVGCGSSAHGKQDVSEPPIDVELDDKSDSPRRPTRGGTLRVGELAVDKFGPTRGFIGYETSLLGGTTVDMFTSGNTDFSLDTIAYVFGPRRPSGVYPGRVLAFNDDAEPGVDVSSRVEFAVPSDGVYLIVVSTYDNYLAFPYHVSDEEYRVMVKCRGEAFEACGDAVSGIDGQCWEDGDCVDNNGGRPLHCEGEVVCAPGTQCLFTQLGVCVEDYAWMTIAPRQCTSPWLETEVTAEQEAQFPIAELARVALHYRGLGIEFDELGVLMAPEPVVTCSGCNCARGDEIVAKVKTTAAVRLAAEGWSYSSSAPAAQGLAPKQCGSNPWQSAGAVSDPFAELEQVDEWLASEGAATVKRGLVWSTEPVLVCEACSCPRGDRLVAFAVDDPARGILAALGFADIYRN